MRLIDRYILKNVLAWTFQALTALLFIFVFVRLSREFRTLLVESDVGFLLLFKFFLTAIPISLEVALPISFLLGVLITFGQLSSSSEITSIRMAGASIRRMALPIFITGFCLSILCLFINSSWIPAAKKYKNHLLYEALKTRPEALIKGGIKDKNIHFTASKVEGSTIYNINWTSLDPKSGEIQRRQAAKGEFVFLNETQDMQLNLSQVYSETEKNGKVIDRSWAEEVGPLNIIDSKKKKKLKRGELSNHEISQILSTNTLTADQQTVYSDEVDERNSISWACLALIFLGLPLSITSARNSSSTGFIISILIGLVYFVLLEVVKSLSIEVGLLRSSLFWIPNILALIIGGYMLRQKETL